MTSVRSIIGAGNKRKPNDFYPTPGYAIDYILDNVKFEGRVWEPSCGDGAISKKLIERGYDVRSDDLNDYGYGNTGLNFLETNDVEDNIITNPLFNISTEYAIKALKHVKRKFVMLNRLVFLEGAKRRDVLFSQNKLKIVHVYSKRLSFNEKSGMLCFAWFEFDNEYNGDPKIKWI
jgi:hypothetical protein